MLQATVSWSTSPNSGFVDSEDESWLNQPKFKLTDDSDSDDGYDIVKASYLQAVAAIKKVMNVGNVDQGAEASIVSLRCHCSAGCTVQTHSQTFVQPGHVELTGMRSIAVLGYPYTTFLQSLTVFSKRLYLSHPGITYCEYLAKEDVLCQTACNLFSLLDYSKASCQRCQRCADRFTQKCHPCALVRSWPSQPKTPFKQTTAGPQPSFFTAGLQRTVLSATTDMVAQHNCQ